MGRSNGFEENLSEDEARKREVADEKLKVALPAIAGKAREKNKCV